MRIVRSVKQFFTAALDYKDARKRPIGLSTPNDSAPHAGSWDGAAMEGAGQGGSWWEAGESGNTGRMVSRCQC